MTSFKNYLASYDIFGQSVSFNYKGDDAYKTSFGGILSLKFKFWIYMCFIMKFVGLATFTQWDVNTQEMQMNEYDLSQDIPLKDFKNFSVGV